MFLVFKINFNKTTKKNVAAIFLLVKKLTFIFFGFSLGFKSSFADMFLFASPICIVEIGIPFCGFLILNETVSYNCEISISL